MCCVLVKLFGKEAVSLASAFVKRAIAVIDISASYNYYVKINIRINCLVKLISVVMG